MAIYYRSQLQGSGSSVEVNSYYVIQGENRWLSGDPRLANLNKSTSDETIIIGDNIFNAEPMNFLNWSGSAIFNSPLIVGNNCYARLENCINLNKPITLGKRCQCREVFKNCKNFNSTVTIYNTSEINCSGMFENCYKYNQSFNIPSGITDCSFMYSGCIEFNQSVNIPNSVNRLQGMFKGCSNFNQQVKLPNSNAGCYEMFNSCTNFNQPVNIPDSIFSCYEMFVHCTNFNSQVTIGNNVTNCNDMFSWCENFNLPVNIPDSVTDCTRMFYWCMNFNSPVKFSNNMISCNDMFYACYNFNQPVNVPDSAVYCTSMFQGCGASPVIFGNNARYFGSTFINCQHDVNVYIKYNGSDPLYVNGMFYGWGEPHNSVRKNVFFNPKWTSLFKKTLNNESITGYNTTWTDMTNGFYNAQYKVYCYNNYTG